MSAKTTRSEPTLERVPEVFRVGGYEITKLPQPGKIWIRCWSGEAMETTDEKLGECLAQFWAQEF